MSTVLENDSLYSKFSTVALLTLKEMRGDRKISHGELAEAAGKSPSAWSKVENGQSQLTINAIYGACERLKITPSFFFDCAERVAQILGSRGWFISFHDNEDGDLLLTKLLDFYKSDGYKLINHRNFLPIESLNSPYSYGRNNLPAVLFYLTDEEFKKAVDSGDEENLRPPIIHYVTHNI